MPTPGGVALRPGEPMSYRMRQLNDSDSNEKDLSEEVVANRRLLSESPSGFSFTMGQMVKAPLYFGSKRKIVGIIVEGIQRSEKKFYEIEVSGGPGCRFAAVEEEIEPLRPEED